MRTFEVRKNWIDRVDGWCRGMPSLLHGVRNLGVLRITHGMGRPAASDNCNHRRD
jgi:hypothetical protein